MPILWLFMALLSLIAFIICLVIDSKAYEAAVKEKKRIEAARKKAAQARKPKELKWPEGLPRYDILEGDK